MDGNHSKTLYLTPSSNGSNNGSTTVNSNWPYIPIQPKQGLVLFIIALIGISANVVALLATLKLIRKHKSAINYLIVALSVTDTYGLVFCTLPTLLCYARKQWVGGMAMCNFQGVSTMFASLASGSLATAMAMERLLAISKPFMYREFATRRKSILTIAGIWSASLVIAVFPLVKDGNFVRNLTGTYCTINWFARHTENIVYAIFYVVLGSVLLGVVLFCNINIAFKLRLVGKNRKALRNDSAKRQLMPKSSDAGEQESVVQEQEARKPSATGDTSQKGAGSKASSSLEKQPAKTVAVISLLFVVCWAPFIIRILCNLTGVWVNAWVDVQVSRLLLINFVLDPFLYTLSRKQCRDIVKMWLCCCCVAKSGRRYSFFGRWVHNARKKHGSFLSSSQTGSSQHINSTVTTTSNIQLLQIKSGSVNTTPDNSVTDVVIHTSGVHESVAPPKEEISCQDQKGYDAEPSVSSRTDTDDGTNLSVTKSNHKTRLHSEVQHKETVAPLERRTSLPSLNDSHKEKEEEMKVDIGYMYDLAFQRQNNES